MWIFEGILYVILLLVFIRYDRKKRLWIKTVSQEEKFEHYLSELSATYGKQKNIEEAVAEVEESHTVTLPTEHSYVRIYGAMCAVIREDGDMLSDGYSVFQRNLQYLKEEIRENLLLCKSKMHGFYRAGCSFRPSGLLPAGCEVLGGPGFRGAVRLLLWQLWNVDNSAPVRSNDWNLWSYPMAVSAG